MDTETESSIASRREAQREVFAAMDRKDNARRALRSAVKSGKIAKPSACERCGYAPADSREIHGHHRDYKKPLDVVWVCRPCHKAEHRGDWSGYVAKAS